VDTGYQPWKDAPFGRPAVAEGPLSEPFCRAYDDFGRCAGLPTKIALYPHGAALLCSYHAERDPSDQARRYEVDRTPVAWAAVPDDLRALCYQAVALIQRQEEANLDRAREVVTNYMRLLRAAEDQVERVQKWIEVAGKEERAILEAVNQEKDHGRAAG